MRPRRLAAPPRARPARGPHAGVALLLAVALQCAAGSLDPAWAQAPAAAPPEPQSPPTGFGPLSLGMPWSEVERAGALDDLTRPGSDWERHVHECGYRSARMTLDGGRLLVTAQDFTVTELSYATRIAAGSDLGALAQQVAARFGPPQATTLRDLAGAIVTDASQARYVVLSYDSPRAARFVLSGAPLWEYRVIIEDDAARRLENVTVRCARERDGTARTGHPVRSS